MVLAKKYQSQESAIATYNYEDIASGTGFVVYYGAKTADDAGVDYILTNNQIYSHGIDTAGATLDLDFDIVFNKPQRIRGNLFANINLSSGGATNVTATVKVRKDDGAEYEIASKTSAGVALAGNDDFTLAVIVPINSIQLFKKGETLRITITTTCSAGTLFLSHDPANRTGPNGITLDTSQLIFHVPFVVDV